jgi:adenylate cyclase class IV
MLELELKGVVENIEHVVARLEALGARPEFIGQLEDRRLDDAIGSYRARDEMLRVRVYRERGAVAAASIDWKGPARTVNGYKAREEVSAPVVDPAAILEVLGRAGWRTTVAIDRQVWQYRLDGVMVRLERYPRMDDLAEVEGEPEAMERVIERLGLPREHFGGDSVFTFARRFEARTGLRAVLGGAVGGAEGDRDA